ncbi:MAG: ATP-dependent DNA helicase [Fimbriimonadales bacterium]
MSHLWNAVEAAFQRLESAPGYETRLAQREMARFVCERLESKSSGLIEAPTGVGKSLAVLLPAIAFSQREKQRVVISTYTNVLAEQYWRKDLPFALSLFPNAPSVALAMGRNRYACLDIIRNNKMKGTPVELVRFLHEWSSVAQEGVESEWEEFLRRKAIPERITRGVWQQIAVPSACRARFCSYYNDCFYYEARRRAADAGIVITNHSFVLTDALTRVATEDQASLLGAYDFLIIDEAHDMLDAAAGALEFTLDTTLLDKLIAHAATMVNQVGDALQAQDSAAGFTMSLQKLTQEFAGRCRDALDGAHPPKIPDTGIAVRVAPAELAEMPALRTAFRPDLHPFVVQAAQSLQAEISNLLRETRQTYQTYKSQLTEREREATEATIGQFAIGFELIYRSLGQLIEPSEGVCWMEPAANSWKACYAPLILSHWLQEHLWRRQPSLLMSATLTVDDSFHFYEQQLGLETPHQRRLEPVFDYSRQCALYLPPSGVIPTPPAHADAPNASTYYQRVAEQITQLLRLTQGRALVLFASRHEMQQVRQRISELPFRILMQGDGANADLSQQFRDDVHSVLFGVRSFWTGFDAPGETLVNLILTRIPFETPTTPLQRARQARYQLHGEDAFREWSLPMVKQQMRQGFGRLIRRSRDVGIVAILDPRMRERSYGREILNNLPSGIPIYDQLDRLARWYEHVQRA